MGLASTGLQAGRLATIVMGIYRLPDVQAKDKCHFDQSILTILQNGTFKHQPHFRKNVQ